MSIAACGGVARRSATTSGSTTDPPRATTSMASPSSTPPRTRSFSRYPRPAAPPSSRASTSRGSANWLSTITPTSGDAARSSVATRRPSASPDGGIRRSVRTTAGAIDATASSNAAPSSQAASRSTPERRAEHLAERLAHEERVVGDHDADRIERSLRMCGRRSPPADATESRERVGLSANRPCDDNSRDLVNEAATRLPRKPRAERRRSLARVFAPSARGLQALALIAVLPLVAMSPHPGDQQHAPALARGDGPVPGLPHRGRGHRRGDLVAPQTRESLWPVAAGPRPDRRHPRRGGTRPHRRCTRWAHSSKRRSSRSTSTSASPIRSGGSARRSSALLIWAWSLVLAVAFSIALLFTPSIQPERSTDAVRGRLPRESVPGRGCARSRRRRQPTPARHGARRRDRHLRRLPRAPAHCFASPAARTDRGRGHRRCCFFRPSSRSTSPGGF